MRNFLVLAMNGAGGVFVCQADDGSVSIMGLFPDDEPRLIRPDADALAAVQRREPVMRIPGEYLSSAGEPRDGTNYGGVSFAGGYRGRAYAHVHFPIHSGSRAETIVVNSTGLIQALAA